MTELNGTVRYANTRARQLLGLPSPLPPFTQLFPRLRLSRPDTGELRPLHLEEVVLKGHGVTMPGCSLSLPDGGSCLVDLRLEPYRGSEGGSLGIVFALRDSSERDRIQGFVKTELAEAARMHRSLLPPDDLVAWGVRSSSFLIPAGFAAGDLYNVFPIDEKHTGVFMIDVAGHGLAAASMALLLNKLLAPRQGSGKLAFLGASPLLPADVVTRLNTMFADDRSPMFFTICYGVIDLASRRLRLVRAGHPYPVLLKSDGTTAEIRVGGNAVGLSSTFTVEEFEAELEPGDRLVIFSDGLSECANAQGEQFSLKRLSALLAETHGLQIAEAVHRLRKEMTLWRGSESFDDDISLLALELPHAGGGA